MISIQISSKNKRKLVPIGKFLTFENLLNKFSIKKITEGYGSFLKGGDNNNLLLNIKFTEEGKHSRFAVGVAALPLNVPVEIDGIFEIED